MHTHRSKSSQPHATLSRGALHVISRVTSKRRTNCPLASLNSSHLISSHVEVMDIVSVDSPKAIAVILAGGLLDGAQRQRHRELYTSRNCTTITVDIAPSPIVPFLPQQEQGASKQRQDIAKDIVTTCASLVRKIEEDEDRNEDGIPRKKKKHKKAENVKKQQTPIILHVLSNDGYVLVQIIEELVEGTKLAIVGKDYYLDEDICNAVLFEQRHKYGWQVLDSTPSYISPSAATRRSIDDMVNSKRHWLIVFAVVAMLRLYLGIKYFFWDIIFGARHDYSTTESFWKYASKNKMATKQCYIYSSAANDGCDSNKLLKLIMKRRKKRHNKYTKIKYDSGNGTNTSSTNIQLKMKVISKNFHDSTRAQHLLKY